MVNGVRQQYCGELARESIGQTVSVCGWVWRRRDHGGVIFIDCVDVSGLLQLVFNPEDQALFSEAESLRNQDVISICGQVRERPEGTVNADLSTGEIECVVQSLTILNRATFMPFPVDEKSGIQVNEDVRLHHRYLDLRRRDMQAKILLRAKVSQALRSFLVNERFHEIETPFLAKATPEGARDYLVPSRVHPGHFYALPQSPQQFKQLLMAAGFERYYQIVRCFRDEDLRADRQPEFTQMDMELSFVDETIVKSLTTQLLRHVFQTCLQVDLPSSFPEITYDEAMLRYGCDRPDLRNPLHFIDIDDLCAKIDFAVFAKPASTPGNRVLVMRVPQGAERLSRKAIDEYTSLVGRFGAKGLAYIKVNDVAAGAEGCQSPILKYFPESVITAILKRVDAQNGDMLFFGAGASGIVNPSMAALRDQLAKDLALLQGDWAPVWVTDFPMFEKADGRWHAVHHPFTQPVIADDEDWQNLDRMRARAYDIVLNGYEIGGGSIRIHDACMQRRVFEVLGIEETEMERQFGHLLSALASGCPPHGGLALGVDRLVMLMAGAQSIREVIAFPKTQSAACLLTKAPDRVEPEQLVELGLHLMQKPASACD